MNRGSSGLRACPMACTHGFNEAPIHESGKSQADTARAAEHIASMRPRFMNRGSSSQDQIRVDE